MAYAFRDTDPAARRLEVVADVFEPATRALLERLRPLLPPGAATGGARALDLGCGPGRTTRLLAEALGCEGVLGVDQSASFLELATARATSGERHLAFHRGDVGAPPFPGAPFDLAFCRFLLSHLRDPGAAIAAWTTQVVAGGLVAVQEVEWIHAPEPSEARYLEIVTAMLESRGQRLCVGAALDAAPDPPGTSRLLSEVVELPVSCADAARMFALNLEAWREDADVVARHGRAALAALARALGRLRGGPRAGDGDALWGLRHLVWRRAEEAP